jgi:hypothetical protein
VEQSSAQHELLRHRLEVGLKLMEHAGELYRQSSEGARQLLNQVFFERIDVDFRDGQVVIAEVVFRPEFEVLWEMGDSFSVEKLSLSETEPDLRTVITFRYLREAPRALRPWAWRTGVMNPRPLSHAWGSNVRHLAEEVGSEPMDLDLDVNVPAIGELRQNGERECR